MCFRFNIHVFMGFGGLFFFVVFVLLLILLEVFLESDSAAAHSGIACRLFLQALANGFSYYAGGKLRNP